jgi:FdhD protein
MNDISVKKIAINRVVKNQLNSADDIVAIEEPLEIRLVYGSVENRISKNISVTMRTPSNDEELAIGFLFTEGILKNISEVKSVNKDILNENIISIELNENVMPEIQKLERNFYTTSSCGVCGKSSIDAIRIVSRNTNSTDINIKIKSDLIYELPQILRQQQSIFDKTGGIHASALFALEGNFLVLKEDVGRHNALDKLIGFCLQNGELDFSNKILLLSGRASFELIQKAAMAGIKLIAAVGAPSSLAVELAMEFDITLIGFLKEDRFNIYCGAQRIEVA